jgi:hypothetical protein
MSSTVQTVELEKVRGKISKITLSQPYKRLCGRLVKELVGDDSWNFGDDTTNSYK